MLDWEEVMKNYSPSKPEKCHTSLINLPLTEHQLRTRQRGDWNESPHLGRSLVGDAKHIMDSCEEVCNQCPKQ